MEGSCAAINSRFTINDRELCNMFQRYIFDLPKNLLTFSIFLSFFSRIQVEQRDVPGIDCAHLAMDTEEGVEVVWNEVQFSERKNFKAQEEKIQTVFENLTQLEHPNIVKFHRYWTDTHNDKPRVSRTLLYL